MGWDLKLNGISIPVRGWSGPGSLRSAFRGTDPGSRECGNASFTLYRPNLTAEQQATASVDDCLVEIGKNGFPRYRGMITEITKETHIYQISSTESAARMNDFDAGMLEVGDMQNPDLYLYVRQMPANWEAQYGHTVTGYGVRTAAALPTIPSRRGFEKHFLFDSFYYTNSAFPMAGQKFRSLLQYERPAGEIIQRAIDLSAGQGGAGITGYDLTALRQSDDRSWTISTEDGSGVPLHYLEGDPVGHNQLWGLITRTIDGYPCTYLWTVNGSELTLYQLVNHGTAVELGAFDFSDAVDYVRVSLGGFSFNHYYHYPFAGVPTEGSFGPFAVPESRWPHILAWYFIGGRYTDGAWKQAVYRYELDLRLPRDYSTDKRLPVRSQSWTETVAQRQPFVEDGSFGSVTTATIHPLRDMTSFRTDGRYDALGEDNPSILWIGGLFLSEAAYDFEDGSLRDVLHSLALARGSEWWVAPDGQLRMDGMEGSARIQQANGVRILSQSRTLRTRQKPASAPDLSGIPLCDSLQYYLSAELERILSEQISTTNKMRIESDGRFNPELGSFLMINGFDAGKIVAVEPDLAGENLELEGDRALFDQPEQEIT